jgi:hypothetical protein
MSISYFGLCKLPVAQAQRRIGFIREAQPEWYDVILLLYDARAADGPFDRELSREFGIDPQSMFMLAINDKERFSDILRDALEFIYEVFGTDDLVITHEMELLHPPRQPHPPMKFP